jgi:DNA repair exonuclease SbcCD ATPase subunit
MLTPKTIIMRNFLSFEDVAYTYRQHETVLVQGVNMTDSGALSNGAGKSSLQEALYFAIVGSSLKNVRQSKFIRRGEERAELVLTLEEVGRDVEYVITRTFQKTGSALKMAVIHNGRESPVQFSSVREGNERILELLGVTAEDLKLSFIINKSGYQSFFTLPETYKRSFIARLAKVDRVADMPAVIQKKIDELDKKYQEGKSSLLKTLTVISTLESQITDLTRREVDNADVSTEIEALYERIEELKVQDDALNTNACEARNDALMASLRDLDKQLNEAYKESKDVTEERTFLNKELARLRNLLQTSITCPQCSHIFSLQDEEFDAERCKKEESQMQTLLAQMEREVLNANKNTRTVQVKIDELNEQRKENEKQHREIVEAKRAIMREMQACLQEVERKQKNNATFTEQLRDELIAGLQKDIKKAEAEREKEKKIIDELHLEIQSKALLQQHFKSFYVYLINRCLKNVENKTNKYLTSIKCNLSIEMEGYRELSNAKLSESITCKVLRDGFLEGELREFSSGEQARIEVATILAFQDLINETGGNFSFLSIDEVLDSLDGEGMLNLVNSLEEVRKTIMLISHISIDDVKNKIEIVKQNGKSTIRG